MKATHRETGLSYFVYSIAAQDRPEFLHEVGYRLVASDGIEILVGVFELTEMYFLTVE